MKKYVDIDHILSTPTANQHKGNLYLGSMSVLHSMEDIKPFRICCVLSIMQQSMYRTYHIKQKLTRNKIPFFHHLGLADNQNASILPQLQASSQFIRTHLEKTNVFVHCQAGASRSASVVIGYLMQQRGIGRDEARDFVKSKRECIKPNNKFWQELLQWEKYVKK